MIENLLRDLRYAVRVLLKSPAFSFIVIATLALGIGATTAIYSVIDATLLHPMPYPNPTGLIHVEDDLLGTGAKDVGISIPEFRDLQSSGIFQSVAIASHGASTNLTGPWSDFVLAVVMPARARCVFIAIDSVETL
jgi:hypothetical protein